MVTTAYEFGTFEGVNSPLLTTVKRKTSGPIPAKPSRPVTVLTSQTVQPLSCPSADASVKPQNPTVTLAGQSVTVGARRGVRPASHQLMADLLQRIAESGDPEAFNELFQSFAPRVKSYMIRQGADPTTAEELAQETLLMVWRKAALYSGDKGSASTWIFTIARNLRIDRLRREVAWQELPEGHNEIVSDDPTPETVVSDRERQARTQAALANLPQEQRDVVSLSYLEGLSHSEIAERMNLPLGTVKSRMRLAYQKIREAVEDLK
jgi:RNA polymerase sigma-70 factor, ECF subfamily